MAELGGFKTPASANACFLVVKKKIMGGASGLADGSTSTPKKTAKGKAAAAAASDANADDAMEGDEATPTKSTPKKRGKAVIKAMTPEEGEGGDLADNEKTPGTASPAAKKGGRKRGAAAAEIISPENDVTDGQDAGEDKTNGTPAKKKRAYNRKPKDANKYDVNATIAKLGKKPSKADQLAMADTQAAIAAANADHDATMANDAEDPNVSLFGGDAQMEEANAEGRTFDDEEQREVDAQLATLANGRKSAV